MKNKKGQAAVIIIMGLVMAFIVVVIYLVLNEPTDTIYQIVENSTAGSIGEETVPKIVNYWRVWPVVALIAIFIFIIVGVLKYSYQEPGY